MNVHYRAKQTFRVQAGITVQLSVGERPLYPRKLPLGYTWSERQEMTKADIRGLAAPMSIFVPRQPLRTIFRTCAFGLRSRQSDSRYLSGVWPLCSPLTQRISLSRSYRPPSTRPLACPSPRRSNTHFRSCCRNPFLPCLNRQARMPSP